ncbi:hypothetical protein WJ542_31000 [Paraburkholderia sp. B3]|uniref:hypothetical protein n=1 Tax=Paraburkholderia sp. B3 TaxID=3134791 RepID=UPI003981EF89
MTESFEAAFGTLTDVPACRRLLMGCGPPSGELEWCALGIGDVDPGAMLGMSPIGREIAACIEAFRAQPDKLTIEFLPCASTNSVTVLVMGAVSLREVADWMQEMLEAISGDYVPAWLAQQCGLRNRPGTTDSSP